MNVRILVSLAALAACQTTGPVADESSPRHKESAGTAIGAASGAAVGAAVGKGNERGRDAIIGAVAGGVAGNRIGAYMDGQEQALRSKLQGTGVGVSREGDKIKLNMPSDITFATGKSSIDPQFQPVLGSVGDVLKQYKDTGVKVEGFTDDVGNAQSNQVLSEQRARSVASFLTSQGIASQRMDVQGFGKSQPAVPNTSVAARAKNRRVQLELYPLAH